MSIGSDLAEVYGEVGTSIKILKPDGAVVLGEYLDFDINRQVTKPFIREFFIEASFSYVTTVVGGDVVEFLADGRKFLVMNLTGEFFENQVIGYNSVLYKCNELVTIKRLTKGGWDGDYKRERVWANEAVDIPILLTERFFGTGLGAVGPQDFLEYDILDNQMFISGYYGVKPLDRVWLSDTEFFKVDFIEKRKFEGVWSCVLSEDTRGSMKKLTRKEKIKIDKQLKRKEYRQGGHIVHVSGEGPVMVVVRGRIAHLPMGRRLPVPEEWWI